MKVLLLGGSGAIGGLVSEALSENSLCHVQSLFSPSSEQFSLGRSDFSAVSGKTFDCMIISVGSYGGLRSYLSESMPQKAASYLDDLQTLIKLHGHRETLVVLVSSAVLENPYSSDTSSPYFEYAQEKLALEKAIIGSTQNVRILRFTNIMSRHENWRRSGHVISSVFRNINEARNHLQIWSHKSDWREFVTEDLVKRTIISTLVEFQESKNCQAIIPCGSGIKFYMEDVVECMVGAFQKDIDRIEFTQPNRRGPLDGVIGVPSITGMTALNIEDLKTNLFEIITVWNKSL